MTRFGPVRICLTIFAVIAVAVVLALGQMLTRGDKGDVRYEPSPADVVERMLQLGRAHEAKAMYDLGSGDGRYVIAAARDFDVERAVGVEIDPDLIERSRANAREAGVAGHTRFVEADLFDYDFRDADLVTLFLLPRLNLRLRPRLLSELAPGTRVVSYMHDMGDWDPDATQRVGDRSIYLWIIPATVEGVWRGTYDGARYRLALQQLYQGVGGILELGGRRYVIADTRLRGRRLSFRALPEGDSEADPLEFKGHVEENRLRGTLRGGDERISVRADRDTR